MSTQLAPSAHPPTPTPVSSSGGLRPAIEIVLAVLVLVGVYWKNITSLFEGDANPAAEATPAAKTPENPRWQFFEKDSRHSTMVADVKKYGAQGWELAMTHVVLESLNTNGKDPEYTLVFKRLFKETTKSEYERHIVGTWFLTKGEKADLTDLTMECTDTGNVIVRGKAKQEFEIKGNYEIRSDFLEISLKNSDSTATTRDKIKKLTATELILADDNGKVEEYRKK